MEGKEKISIVGVKSVADDDVMVVGFILVGCALEAGLIRTLLAVLLTRLTSPAMASTTLRYSCLLPLSAGTAKMNIHDRGAVCDIVTVFGFPVAAVEDFLDEMAV